MKKVNTICSIILKICTNNVGVLQIRRSDLSEYIHAFVAKYILHGHNDRTSLTFFNMVYFLLLLFSWNYLYIANFNQLSNIGCVNTFSNSAYSIYCIGYTFSCTEIECYGSVHGVVVLRSCQIIHCKI